MRIKNNKQVLIGILCTFMICLVASSVTTVVAEDYWGNLKVGDEMTWEMTGTAWGETLDTFTYEWTLLEVDNAGETLTVSYTLTFGSYAFSSSSETFDGDETVPLILPASELHNTSLPTQTYTFKGTGYKAAYGTDTQTEDGVTDTIEMWVDYDTGILFEMHFTETGAAEGDTDTTLKLTACTADLTEGGGTCLGTILIALVSVATFVTYGLVRYQKKEN